MSLVILEKSVRKKVLERGGRRKATVGPTSEPTSSPASSGSTMVSVVEKSRNTVTTVHASRVAVVVTTLVPRPVVSIAFVVQ